MVKLACIPLCWLLSSPNRFMRDWVTKALVQLLRGHLDVMRALFERFWTVDDPYVVQRMVAIAYGALLRSTPTQADQAKALAEAVHAKIFARPVRADELLLDAARGITRWAVAHQFLPDSALDSARRPYGLKPPAAPPTKETIEAKYGWRQGQPDDESYSAIDSSVLGMGDFGRYVIASGLHDFSRYRIGQEYPERGDRQPRLVKKRWNEFVSSLSDKQKAALADQLRDPVQHELSSLSFMMRREKDPLSKRQRALYEAAFVYPKPVNDGYPAARSPPAAHPLMLRLVNKNAASRFRCTGKLCRAGQSGGSERLYSWGMSQGGLALLLRLNKSWRDGISAEDLYEITRAWWVISPANAQRVERVLAVAGGVVREVYRPTRWLPSPIEGLENRIGFEGVVAPDRENYVGRDVSRLFRHGSANPVRYLPLDALLEQAVITPDPVSKTPLARAEEIPSGAVEPGLLERVLPLLDAFEKDLLWAQSRAGQELFHSNTIAWLLRNFPIPCAPLLDLLGATRYDGVSRVDVWRERRHLDIVIDPVGASPKVVIENKLYSVPYPAQLTQYNAYSLPWSADHGDGGARATRYVLLSLMAPSFPLPAPWTHVDYRDLAGALDQIDAAALGRTSDQLIRYRALIHRLVALAEAVDPAQALDEPFSATDVVAQLPGGGLDGAIARMRFSGLAQVVQTHFHETKSFEVGGDRGGIITYWRRLADKRGIGWQFQESQLRFFVTVEDPDLQGEAQRAAREEIVQAEHTDFFDHTAVEAILGSDLRAKSYAPGAWLGFNPDFVYRHRPVKPAASTAVLAQALASMTKRVDDFADKAGYDT